MRAGGRPRVQIHGASFWDWSFSEMQRHLSFKDTFDCLIHFLITTLEPLSPEELEESYKGEIW